jgi:hypothetical protein
MENNNINTRVDQYLEELKQALEGQDRALI